MDQHNQGKGGIVFFRTTRLKEVSCFYQEIIGCDLWLDQGGCHILKYGNMLFGLCQRDSSDLNGLVTFVYPEKEGVDLIYKQIKESTTGVINPPCDNSDYRIYHFFSKDPEGRSVEFQYFWDDLVL